MEWLVVTVFYVFKDLLFWVYFSLGLRIMESGMFSDT